MSKRLRARERIKELERQTEALKAAGDRAVTASIQAKAKLFALKTNMQIFSCQIIVDPNFHAIYGNKANVMMLNEAFYRLMSEVKKNLARSLDVEITKEPVGKIYPKETRTYRIAIIHPGWLRE